MKDKKDYEGKFVVGFDTMVDGWQCAKDEDENPVPTLHDSELDALRELFDDALAMIESKDYDELEECEISQEQLEEMRQVYNEGDAKKMAKFLEENPICNYNAEFVVSAEEFLVGRKSIFGSEGLQIIGKHLWEF